MALALKFAKSQAVACCLLRRSPSYNLGLLVMNRCSAMVAGGTHRQHLLHSGSAAEAEESKRAMSSSSSKRSSSGSTSTHNRSSRHSSSQCQRNLCSNHQAQDEASASTVNSSRQNQQSAHVLRGRVHDLQQHCSSPMQTCVRQLGQKHGPHLQWCSKGSSQQEQGAAGMLSSSRGVSGCAKHGKAASAASSNMQVVSWGSKQQGKWNTLCKRKG
jgi:hypothetical protein